MNALAQRELHILYNRKVGKRQHDVIVDDILDILSNGIYEPAGHGAGFGIDDASIDDLYALMEELGVIATKLPEEKKHDPMTQKIISGANINDPMFGISEHERSPNKCIDCGKRTDIEFYRPNGCDCIPF